MRSTHAERNLAIVHEASSYAVLWSEADGRPVAGRLTPGRESLRLQGSRDGRLMQRTVAYRDLDGVRIGRRPGEVLDGRPAIVVERHGAPILLVRPLGPGLLHELGDLLAELCASGEIVEQIAVVLPLREDALESARALVAEGPPFRPAEMSLARHEVFLTSREAIFVFSGADVCETVRTLIRDTAVWPAADRWLGCLDGPPRVAEASFAWPPRDG